MDKLVFIQRQGSALEKSTQMEEPFWAFLAAHVGYRHNGRAAAFDSDSHGRSNAEAHNDKQTMKAAISHKQICGNK